jgi:hypothetical protein
MLATTPAIVNNVGPTLVKPSVYYSPIAQPISSNPAIVR